MAFHFILLTFILLMLLQAYLFRRTGLLRIRYDMSTMLEEEFYNSHGTMFTSQIQWRMASIRDGIQPRRAFQKPSDTVETPMDDSMHQRREIIMVNQVNRISST